VAIVRVDPLAGSIDRASQGFDIIGDIHGCHSHLVELLHALGYRDDKGYFHHPQRQVIFVGDLIDRGPEQVAVIDTVRAMHKQGTAKVVMGNHEFNAVCYATRGSNGRYLRRRNKKNRSQHKAFRKQTRGQRQLRRETIEWFKTLPLWIDEKDFRVVHACWDPAAIDGLKEPELEHHEFVAASDRESKHYRWVEHLCKGPEVRLPIGHEFSDKDGHRQETARVDWWTDEKKTFRSACLIPSKYALPNDPIPDFPVPIYKDEKPVFFGHYWFEWEKTSIMSNAACLDYSAVKGGPLVAYRWSGETTLDQHNLVGVTG